MPTVCGGAEPGVGPAARCWSVWCPSMGLLAAPALKLVLDSSHHGDGLKCQKRWPSGQAWLKGHNTGIRVSVGCWGLLLHGMQQYSWAALPSLFLWLQDALPIPAVPNSFTSGSQGFTDSFESNLTTKCLTNLNYSLSSQYPRILNVKYKKLFSSSCVCVSVFLTCLKRTWEITQ